MKITIEAPTKKMCAAIADSYESGKPIKFAGQKFHINGWCKHFQYVYDNGSFDLEIDAVPLLNKCPTAEECSEIIDAISALWEIPAHLLTGQALKSASSKLGSHSNQPKDKQRKDIPELTAKSQAEAISNELFRRKTTGNISDGADNSWHEKGDFPPAGTKCEVMFKGEWYETYIVGMDGEWCVHVSKGFESTSYNGDNDPSNFRPIKSEREKFVEAAKSISEFVGDSILEGGAVEFVASKMFDSGEFKYRPKEKGR